MAERPWVRHWVLWGSELSPFALKLALCCRVASLPYRFLPAEGRWLDNVRAALRVEALKRGALQLTWPVRSENDEYPLVPYLLGPGGQNLYDSSAIAEWLDARLEPAQRLIPAEPLAHCVARLIDDYADECLLYVVHHQRWVTSARDNDAGLRVAREFKTLNGPTEPLMAAHFSARQTRRLPYLFSVAPAGFQVPGLPRRRQPPTRDGFPPTHALLEGMHTRVIHLLEALLAQRPYVLGTRFSLADAALYGQLAMNLSDPTTARRLQSDTPRLYGWLQALHTGMPQSTAGDWQVDAPLKPLLAEITRIHLPLMQQNAAAVRYWRSRGQRRFNEAAFNAGEALYEGVLDGTPFKHVAKTFQARTWRDAQARVAALPLPERRRLEQLMPGAADFFTV